MENQFFSPYTSHLPEGQIHFNRHFCFFVSNLSRLVWHNCFIYVSFLGNETENIFDVFEQSHSD